METFRRVGENARRFGTIAAFDIVVRDGGYLSNLAPRLIAYFREHGLLLRPLGNTVYVMPPYILSDDDAAFLAAGAAAALEAALA